MPHTRRRSIYGIVLAGGEGQRLWPLSRKKRPKYSLCVGSKKSLIGLAYSRLCRVTGKDNVYIATQALHVPLVKELLPSLKAANIITEPVGRNTAAAIGLAAKEVLKRNPDVIMAIVPADQLVFDKNEFVDSVKKAIKAARVTNGLVMIGIKPTYPSTGYGYVKPENREQRTENRGLPAYKVQNFVEKPDLKTAKKFVRQGYFWNSGIFVSKASVMLGAIGRYMPELYAVLTGPRKGFADRYRRLDKISIDHGVMQKAKNVYIVKSPMKWDDVGSWSSFTRIQKPDAGDNVIKAKHKGIKTKNCCIISDTKRLIATCGIKDLVIFDAKDALLVCAKDKAEKVKDLADLVGKDKELQKYL